VAFESNMERQIKQIEFSKLKFAYQTVKEFLDNESFKNVKSLKTTVAGDLSLLGDDNGEMLGRFIEKFELDYDGFKYEKHFYDECELFGSEAALANLLTLSVWLPLKTIELLTLNKLKIKKPNFNNPGRDVSDMTFKDLLTWYLEGNYATADQIKYELKNAT
jgi:hypothetical protein